MKEAYTLNKIAKTLFIIGWLCIISGTVLAFSNNEVTTFSSNLIPNTEKTWPLFLMYLLAGIITGILMFGFAEIINILDNKRGIEQETLGALNHIQGQIETIAIVFIPKENEGSNSKGEVEEIISRKEINKILNREDPIDRFKQKMRKLKDEKKGN